MIIFRADNCPLDFDIAAAFLVSAISHSERDLRPAFILAVLLHPGTALAFVPVHPGASKLDTDAFAVSPENSSHIALAIPALQRDQCILSPPDRICTANSLQSTLDSHRQHAFDADRYIRTQNMHLGCAGPDTRRRLHNIGTDVLCPILDGGCLWDTLCPRDHFGESHHAMQRLEDGILLNIEMPSPRQLDRRTYVAKGALAAFSLEITADGGRITLTSSHIATSCGKHARLKPPHFDIDSGRVAVEITHRVAHITTLTAWRNALFKS
ncbi:hypothetical protein FIBSPDRAFT_896645 [Athelia psychrophila]|uniref:Uncharacterized protein n=1 Tax=Athelia psychrophila TaxID=1759441 RepID=A0A166D7C0_9AGAM|nr:hypothetical protein FIBSPDRAFT_896645 [Fibularhizoctonia sp. CBS 109695]